MKYYLLWVDKVLYRVWFNGEHIRYEGCGPYTVNGTSVVLNDNQQSEYT